MQLTPSQQKALDIERHICVTAGAGSGKTTVLVERYLKILREGNVESPREIVAITFTEKAAAEMKERIIKELSPQDGNGGVGQNDSLQRFREEMGSAHISTIHAFCSRILREFPFQAGVPANFSIVQGIDQKLLLQQTIKDTLRGIATDTEDKHRPELTRLLQRYGGQQKLVDFFSAMVNQREGVAQIMREVYGDQSKAEIREYWQQKALMKLKSAVDLTKFIRCLKAVLGVARGKNSEPVRDLTQRLETLSEKNPNALEVLNVLKEIATLIVTGRNDIAKRDFIKIGVEIRSVETEVDFLVFAAKKIKDTPALGVDDDFLINTTRDLLTLYTRLFDAYETAKFAQGDLDFDDLQTKTRDLLRNNEKIQQELIKRYRYYMVDEYQDTNEVQHELVMLLTNELKSVNLFIVGDPKQSIYGFRGADVRIFDKTKKIMLDQNGIEISLKENFRSLQSVIGFANYFFYRLMGDGTKTEFEVPYESLIRARSTDANGAIDVIVGKKDDAAANEPVLIAQHIKNMKTNEETVWIRGENGGVSERPIRYGDIAILIRSRTHLPGIEHALLEADVPYLTTGGIGFYQRQEIYDIWNYLNFLNAPTENHASLVGVLRGPAFGVADPELYEISLQDGTNFWEKAENYQAGTDNLHRAVATLKRHIQIAHRMPVNQLVRTIVNETGMIGTLETGKQGQQRWANYQKLLELARNFDGDENTQILPDFIEFLNILITEEPREGQAPIEAGEETVQIMTIHVAKGKQFPIVMLPCLDRGAETAREPFIDEALGIGFSPLNPDKGYRKTEPAILTAMKRRATEKEDAEKKRLFYVGATRAEDRLILSGTLADNGKPRQMFEWLHEHLGIDEKDHLPSLPFELEMFVDNSRQPEDTTFTDKITDKTTPVEFPALLPSALQPTLIDAAFSVSELANYARCPLRYQLENLLQLPAINGDTDPDGAERDRAIRGVLARIRQRSDTENLDSLINETLENHPEITSQSTEVLRTSVNNFINAELGGAAFKASQIHVNQHIHANINGHIIEGSLDRLFKDETGQYQLILYNTSEIRDLDTHRPEMELYALLVHRRYPEQSTVTVNLFFTRQGQSEPMHFSAAQLQAAQERWQKKISGLQSRIYEKNLEHCCSCPYSDSNGQCVVTEA